MKIDLDQIRNLLAVVTQTDITELTIESADEKITVKKSPAVSQPVATPAPVPAFLQAKAAVPPAASPVQPPPQPTEAEKPESSNGFIQITSPMVGTFYRASAPTSAPFIEVGDHINVGQTVCIIEAMKLMNDLPSEVAGKLIRVLVDNGTTVEYGQPLFLVDPKG
jgi:acetyl-CoA carboxylase biotin carboxyl carrier protein